jgi:pimeloyl-ACP methyl ester carboxylesterase
MELTVGRFRVQLEQPQTLKFAWPLLMLPDLFMTREHLAIPIGYFVSIGWEVYAADLFVPESNAISNKALLDWAAAVTLAHDLIAALGRELIPIGHGAGGLLAMASANHPHAKAAVALAPLMPGFNSPALRSIRSFFGRRGRMINPPRGQTLFDLFADAEAFHREHLVRALVPASGTLGRDIVSARMSFARGQTPRLIVAGESDRFAPIDMTKAFAAQLGARLITIPGRGHWLFSGRTLERVVAEVQRFLVHALGADLLLLYSDES